MYNQNVKANFDFSDIMLNPDNKAGSGIFTVHKTDREYYYKAELDRNFEFVHIANSVKNEMYISPNTHRSVNMYLNTAKPFP